MYLKVRKMGSFSLSLHLRVSAGDWIWNCDYEGSQGRAHSKCTLNRSCLPLLAESAKPQSLTQAQREAVDDGGGAFKYSK